MGVNVPYREVNMEKKGREEQGKGRETPNCNSRNHSNKPEIKGAASKII